MNVVDTSGWLEYYACGENANFCVKAIKETKDLLVI